MSENVNPAVRFRRGLRDALLALKRDLVLIVVFTVAMTALGFVAGKKVLTTNRSTAHLVVAPIPSQGAPASIEVAPKLDITSVTLLCKSDEVLRRTFDEIVAAGRLARPIPSIRALAKSLSYQITVAKETPMDTVFSEVLELTAKSKVPEDAALMVNTWAEQIIEAVDRYEAGLEVPLLEIFNSEFGEAERTLTQVEEEKDKWYTEHDLELLHARIETVRGLVMAHIEQLTNIDSQLHQEKAKLEAYKKSVQYLEPKLELSWLVPEGAILEQLQTQFGAILGLDAAPPKPKSAGPQEKSESDAEDAAAPLDGASGESKSTFEEIIRKGQKIVPQEGTQVLTRETLNDAYWWLYGELLMSESTVAGLEAMRERTLELLDQQETELQDLNEEITRLETEKVRLERRYGLAENVHDVFHERRKWIEIASQVDYHTLQVLSRGTAWPETHLWGLFTAGALGVCAFVFAVCGSLLMRLLVLPAFKETA